MMAEFDLVVRGGTVVTAADKARCDVGIRAGRVVALAEDLPKGKREIDASDRLVLPGGIDSHVHIEQKGSYGITSSDDFFTGTRSALFGGNTTVMPFAAQHRGQGLRQVVEAYRDLATPKAVCDYAFHLIVSDPTEQVLGQELPALIQDGFTSFKVFMTYDLMKLDDGQMLDVLSVARREGALVMVHAENHEVIKWITKRLLDRGHRAPKYHAISHARLAEGEATHRAIVLSELMDTPLLIVHVSAEMAMDAIRDAQTRGLKVYGETCPQYLFLTAQDIDKPGLEGAKFCCSPPPRDEASQEAMWRGLENGTFQLFSSDHAPYRFDETAKLSKGPNAHFREIPPGMPGVEARAALLFSEGVRTGRIDIHRFVELNSTNAAKIYGLFPRKGTIAIGSDADIAIWEPDLERTITWDDLHDNVGDTPYEGKKVTGWPTIVIRRGEVVVEGGELHAEPGSGAFLPCATPEPARPRGLFTPEMDPARNFGANLVE
jgi:dihydropyrimidinase